MNSEQGVEARRYVIGIGLPRCDGMGLDALKRVDGDVQQITDYLVSQQGYVRALTNEIPSGAPAGTVRRELSRWFASDERRSDDTVVLYVAGHGGPAGRRGRHHVFTVNSNPGEPDETAIATARLGVILFDGEGERPQNVLLILDTCSSGSGAGHVAAMIAEAKGAVQDAPGAGFWVIASAGPDSGAGDGHFISGLLAVIGGEKCAPIGGTVFIDPLTLVEEINEWFRVQKHPQAAQVDLVGGGQRPRGFLRNPNFTRDRDGVALADEGHWNPKGRGVEELASTGWFFTGRKAACRALTGWLSADRSDARARVVTGRPGSGKSAVLSVLVLSSDPESRSAMEAAGVMVQPDDAPGEGTIDVAVHARGADRDTVCRQIAAKLKLSADLTVPDFVRALAARHMRVAIVVDALDESSDPRRLERELLLPLAACPSVRLIVGSRPIDGRPPLEGAAEIIDLDTPEYFDREDIVSYVEARLTRAVPPTGYRRDDARRVGARVADRAKGSFLYARIVSRRIAEQLPIDTQAEGWDKDLPLPDELRRVFDMDLARFAEPERKRIVDLLLPLAYARGKGLPQKRIWCLLASRIAGRPSDQPYTNSDIRELRDRAGFYVVQDTEHDETVFRLFHQEFADYLRAKTRDEAIDRTIAETLWSLDDPPAGNGEWLRRDEPYVRHHLAAHAASGGLLGRFLVEPEYLLRLSPASLLPHLPTPSTGEAGAIARAYRQVSHNLRGDEPVERRAYLSTAMMQHGVSTLAQTLLHGELPWLWKPLWTRWTPAPPTHVIAKGNSEIVALATCDWEAGRPVALVGRVDGAVEVWDLRQGDLLAAWKPDQARYVREIELMSTPAGPLLVAAWGSGELGVLELATGQETFVYASQHRDLRITALCIANIGSQPVCIVATDDLRLTVRSLPSLDVVTEHVNATASTIFALRPICVEGEQLLVSGGDSMRSTELREKSRLRLWSLPDLRPIWGDERAKSDCIQSLTLGRVTDRDVLIASTEGWGRSEIWDLETRTLMFEEPKSSARTWLLPHEKETVVISALPPDLLVRRIGVADVAANLPLHLEEASGNSGIQGSHFTNIVELHGRHVVLSAVLDHVRVWDLEERLTTPSVASNGVALRQISASALTASRDGRSSLFAGTSDGQVFALEADTGVERWHVAITMDGRIACMSHLQRGDRGVVVVGVEAGGIHVLDADEGRPIRAAIATDGSVEALDSCEWDAEPLVFATVGGRRSWAARMWNLDSGEECRPRRAAMGERMSRVAKWELSAGEEDKPLYGLAVTTLRDRVRVAFAGKYGKVMVGDHDADDMTEVASWQAFDEWWIPNADGVENTRALASGGAPGARLLAAGTEGGHLAVWNFETSVPKADHARAHVDAVFALAFQPADDEHGVLVSGGRDGALIFWTVELRECFRIDIGEAIVGITWLATDRLAVATVRGVVVIQVDARRLARMAESLLDRRRAS
jgi:WD40 repeat protein